MSELAQNAKTAESYGAAAAACEFGFILMISLSRSNQINGRADGDVRICRQPSLNCFEFGAVLWGTSGKTDGG